MRRDMRRDDQALTAVIEFLSAFVLFLVIVSAFLSLTRLTLGPNEPMVDRLDEHAADGLMRLTSSEGWAVPLEDGVRDTENSTSDWHLLNASTLLDSDVLPGLADSNGHIDPLRIQALQNLTEGQLKAGLGFPSYASVNLSVQIIESPESNRVGTVLFLDGTPRSSATTSAASFRTMPMGAEIIEISLEVHNAGSLPPLLMITEFSPHAVIGEPEWIEIHNEGGFAVDLNGWGVARNGFFTLIGTDALGGDQVLLLSGDPSVMEHGNASLVIDVSSSYVLGRGLIDGLDDSADTLRLTYNEPGSSFSQGIHTIPYDNTWDFEAGYSAKLSVDGGWNVSDTTSPGDL
ncbi:MAG TPA: lamin tail domain-containing protein [Candidatus Thalassarchaeaceae archaeon]|nr:MAG TPA: lamin tail domain-containing protein [Candidatus Poseidoniales archaeon]HIH84917.1 lamin tail domain-containing protein [Candidatus Thalassarchaeaceae archaeon]